LLSIESVRTAPGTTITVPVDVKAASPLAALSVRLRYDPTFLTLAGVSNGTLLSPSHELHYSAPDYGQLNIVVYSPTGATPFTASSGTVMLLNFAPSAQTRIGHVTEIGFDANASIRLVSSDLSDLSGASVPHTAATGLVSFITTARHWPLYE
jgi:hypothetical protein